MLSDEGVEVISVDEEMKGVSDKELLKKSSEEGLIILSFDSDFSDPELAYSGVIRLSSVASHSTVVESC